MSGLREIARELRYAVRSMRRSPTFAAAAVLTLALGIGANAAIFSVVYGVLLRPLPYRDPDRLVFIQTRSALTGRVWPGGFSGPNLPEWSAAASAFESLALCANDVFALDTGDGFISVPGADVSQGFFSIVGGAIALGRPPDDATAPEIVISSRLWRSSFGSDRAVLGRMVRLNAKPYTIVGVAGPELRLPLDERRSVGAPAIAPDIWAPLELQPGANDRQETYYQFIGRLRPGVSLAQARASADAAATAVGTQHDPTGRKVEPIVVPLVDELTGDVRPALLLLLGAVALVLLIACSNVANLLLARQSSRAREMAIRVSLGASRSRLAIHALAEAAMIALLGGAAGVVVAQAAATSLRSLEPAGVPRIDAIEIGRPVFAFTLVISIAAALLAAAGPLFELFKGERTGAVRATSGGTRQTAGRGVRRLRSALVIAQLALSFSLLIGAILLGRSFVNLLDTDIGTKTDGVLTVELNLAMGRTVTTERQIELTREVVERISALPRVDAAGAANGLPPNRMRMAFQFESADASGRVADRWVSLMNPTPGYFAALGIAPLRGRSFSVSDTATSPSVVILSAGLARHLFGTLDVVGRSLPIGPKRGPVPIVGVVADVKYRGLQADAPDTLYMPFAQHPFRNMTLVARTAGDSRLIAADVLAAIHDVDREIMLGPARPLDEVMSEAVAQPRFRTAFLASIAGLALLLAAIGLYGVVSYAVTERTVEMGVRLALGATSARVIGMVLREGLILAAGGALIGALGALALSRALSSFLFGIGPLDALSFALAAAMLVGVTLFASYVPARRAARVDPLVALRCE